MMQERIPTLTFQDVFATRSLANSSKTIALWFILVEQIPCALFH